MSRKNRERRIQNRRTKQMHIDEATSLPARTPAAQWREKGEADPHGTDYDCERAKLTYGNMTDDEIANAIFMHDFRGPMDFQGIIDGTAHSGISLQQGAKERIRWLSRSLVKAEAELAAMKEAALAVSDSVKSLTVSTLEIPLGYALVPIQRETKVGLTDDMMREFYDAWELHGRRGQFERLNAAYNAMVAAVRQTEIIVQGRRGQHICYAGFAGMSVPETMNCLMELLRVAVAEGIDTLHLCNIPTLKDGTFPDHWPFVEKSPEKLEAEDQPWAEGAASALQALKVALQADKEYAWSWHHNLATQIFESLRCTSDDANKAAASLMLYFFAIDVRSFEEWKGNGPDWVSSNDAEEFQRIRDELESMINTKIYDDRDRGYNKAINHVITKVPELLKNLHVLPVRSVSAASEMVTQKMVDAAVEEFGTLSYNTFGERIQGALTAAWNAQTTPIQLTTQERATLDQLILLSRDEDASRTEAFDRLDKLPENPGKGEGAHGKVQHALRRLRGDDSISASAMHRTDIGMNIAYLEKHYPEEVASMRAVTIPSFEGDVTQLIADLKEHKGRFETIRAESGGPVSAGEELVSRLLASVTLTGSPDASRIDVAFAGGPTPTHQCTICGALWRKYQEGDTWSWNLRSKQCGKCCDSAEMGEQIVSLSDETPGWEYGTVEGGRKSSGEAYPPEGDGWVPDYSRGRPGQAWDRFDNHEENYWKRPIQKAD
jgi:hypothetical protein